MSEEYNVGEISEEEMSRQRRYIYPNHEKWAKKYLTKEEREQAEKAAKLIARDYGETIKELGDA